MKLRQLEFACALADTCSFSRAAERCNATQPTLSNAIAQLEQELGGRLFERSTRQVEQTPFGDYLIPFLRAVLDGRNELVAAAEAYHNPVHKLLRIGFSPLIDVRMLNRVIEPFRQRHSEIKIFFKECYLDDLAARLGNDSIDMAVIPQAPQPETNRNYPFYEDPLYYLPCQLGEDKPVGAPLHLSALPDAPIILTGGGCGLNGSLQNLFEQQGARFDPYTGQAISYSVIADWASLGIGAGILPKAKLPAGDGQGVRAVPLVLDDGSAAQFRFEWVWSNAAPERAHISAFVEYIATTVPALVSGAAAPISARSQGS